MARPAPLCYLDRMDRAGLVLLVVLAIGCPAPSRGSECQLDAECDDGEVCARDSVCTPASGVRSLTTTWTIRGAAADDTTCATHPEFFISFIGRDYGDQLGYAPVPCKLGRFFIDKLPRRFQAVQLGVEGGPTEIASFGSSDTVAIDVR
jgi:hypothetical protein